MPKKVMVLEDQAMLYELLHDLLHFEGFEVCKPNQLKDVVSEMRADPPVAAIIDVNLKEVNGLELLDQIRNDETLNSMAVLISSGLDYKQESLKRGADGFLQKPYMPDELVNLLHKSVRS